LPFGEAAMAVPATDMTSDAAANATTNRLIFNGYCLQCNGSGVHERRVALRRDE
jgi:hypothetical protein